MLSDVAGAGRVDEGVAVDIDGVGETRLAPLVEGQENALLDGALKEGPGAASAGVLGADLVEVRRLGEELEH